ncbi:probable oligoribonuclease [Odontomachus brunneus]|uniref:probable oligoribonuclease n=1 Tax=Odontomachus brunneus TaxID=486640 RepID=UPI0013F1F304|nr:probable oligoribonuclease [Odontomachus brunneus]
MNITRSVQYLFKYLYRGTQHFLRNDRAIASSTIPNDNKDKHMVWLDMEMTGLDVENSHILEIACLITDENLVSKNDYLSIVIYQPEEVLENMTDWCKVQHEKTGLVAACQSSKIMLNEAKEIMLQYLKNHIPYKMCPLAGNSVHIDRMFLKKYMPLVDDYLHYRIIDVSTIRELAR